MQKISLAKYAGKLIVLLALALPLVAVAQEHNYTVTNNSACSLGLVTLSCATGSTHITVGASATYVTPVPSTVSSVTINGQTAVYPSTTDITLPNNKRGRVIFTSTTSVVIIDILEGV